MFLMISLLFSLFYITLYLENRKTNNYFSPISLISVLHIITIIPYLYLILIDNSKINFRVTNHHSYKGFDKSLATYIILQALSFVIIFISIKLPKIRLSKNKYYFKINEEEKKLKKLFYFTFVIGSISYLYFFSSIGGISHILNNLHKRSSIIGEANFITRFRSFYPISVYVKIYLKKFSNDKKINKLDYLIILSYIVLSSITGGRKDSLYFIITIAIIYHYSVTRIKSIPKKTYLIIPLVLVYFIGMPLLRKPNAIQYYKEKGNLVSDISDNVDIVLKQVSYVDHYIFILNNFNPNNAWVGKSFTDLKTSFIPSKLYPNKPPVDDGVYIRTMVEGIDVGPNTPFKYLYPSSWPPETMGVMYMNFLTPGVIIGMFILGRIYKFSYNFMINNKFNLISILIFSHLILNFEISNLRIVQLVSYLVNLFLLFSIFSDFKIIRKVESN